MSVYYYLDASLELNTTKHLTITAEQFLKHVTHSMNVLFGEVGASADIRLLKYNQNERRGLLKIPEDHFVGLYGALTLNGLYGEDIECAYRVHKTGHQAADFDILEAESDSE